jgi:hypothetical protein
VQAGRDGTGGASVGTDRRFRENDRLFQAVLHDSFHARCVPSDRTRLAKAPAFARSWQRNIPSKSRRPTGKPAADNLPLTAPATAARFLHDTLGRDKDGACSD